MQTSLGELLALKSHESAVRDVIDLGRDIEEPSDRVPDADTQRRNRDCQRPGALRESAAWTPSTCPPESDATEPTGMAVTRLCASSPLQHGL